MLYYSELGKSKEKNKVNNYTSQNAKQKIKRSY
jgi:hypothetical protein